MRLWPGDDLDDGDDVERWMAKRAADVAQLNDPQSDAAGRDAWATATKQGYDLSASTPFDVRALGAAQLACGNPPSDALDQMIERARAAGRGATDAVLLGHGDEAEAAVRSLPALFSDQPITSRFHQMMQSARDQDQYDQIHYPLSRGLGEAAGTALDVVATDGVAAAMAPRLAATAVGHARDVQHDPGKSRPGRDGTRAYRSGRHGCALRPPVGLAGLCRRSAGWRGNGCHGWAFSAGANRGPRLGRHLHRWGLAQWQSRSGKR